MSKKLLRKKLALMLATLKKKRKYYVECEYLETTNQQNDNISTNNAAYIDTGVTPDNTTKIECRVQFTTLISGNSSEALFGATGVSSSKPARMAFGFASVSPYTNFYMGLGIQNLTTSVARDTNVHIFTIDASTSSWKIDDTTGTFSNPGEVVGDGPMYLFARNYAAYEYANKPANARTYYCKIWKGGSLVRDMIPVLDWNYVPCMYDKVTEQLFYSAGTGNFIAGREIHPVEYLESTGVEYIDTGVEKGSVSIIRTIADLSFNNLSTINAAGWGQSLSGGCFGFKQNATYIYFNLTGTDENSTLGYTAGKRLKFDLDGVNGTFTIYDGESVAYTATKTSSTSTSNDVGILFGFKNTSGINTKAQTIYSYKMYKNNALVRDYIPAIDENGVGFMFDRVSHTIYDNAGTGAFGYPAREVEYLEGTGTQYIDTGVRGFADFEIGVKLRESVSNVSIFCSNNYRLERYNASNPYWRFRNNNDFYISSVPITEYHVMAWKNDEVYADGVKLQDFAKTWNVPANMTLFGASASSSFPSMIYFCKLWNPTDGTLLRDFIPVYKDGLSGLLDKANGVLYQNSGTGTFTTGKIVEPEYE